MYGTKLVAQCCPCIFSEPCVWSHICLESCVQEEWNENEDPLYEASDMEGGDVGIADDGEVSVPPELVIDAGEDDTVGFV